MVFLLGEVKERQVCPHRTRSGRFSFVSSLSKGCFFSTKEKLLTFTRTRTHTHFQTNVCYPCTGYVSIRSSTALSSNTIFIYAEQSSDGKDSKHAPRKTPPFFSKCVQLSQENPDKEILKIDSDHDDGDKDSER